MSIAFKFALGAACAAASAAGFSPCGGAELIADPNAVWGTFSNGFRYVLYPNKTPEKQVVMRLYVASGSLMEREEQRGLAHFLEHMAFNGTRHFPAGEMVAYFQRIGMAFGSDTNAHTSFDETVYKLNLPSADAAVVADSLRLLRDYADGMLLPESEIERERGVILSELHTRDTPEYRMAEDFYQFRFEGTRLGARLPIGSENVIKHAPRAEFADYYARWYAPERMTLVVAGDFDVAAIRAAVAAAFDAPFEGKIKTEPPVFEPLKKGGDLRVRAFVEPQASAVQISLSAARPFDGKNFVSEDTPDARLRRARLALALLAVQNRLKRAAQRPDASNTESSAYRMALPARFGELASVEVTCEPDRWQDALALVDRTLRGARVEGFSESEAAEAVAAMRNELKARDDKADTRTSADIAQALLDDISEGRTTLYPKDEYAFYAPMLDAANAETLRAALADFWDGAAPALHISGPLPTSAEDVERRARATLEAAARLPLPKPEDAASAAFAYGDWGAAGARAETRVNARVGVTQVRFANNVCLSVKPTRFQARTVQLLVRAGHGVLAPKGGASRAALERAAACKLLASVAFLKGGLEAHSYADVERFGTLNRWTEFLRFECESDAACFSAKIPVEALPFTLNAICAYLEHAGWREDALGQGRQMLEQLYREARHTAEGVLTNDGARFLACGDPRFGLPDEKATLALSMADLRAWLEPQLRGGFLEVSIAGDIAADDAVAAVARTFGALPARAALAARAQDYPADANAVAYPAPCEKIFDYPSDLPRAFGVFVWPTCDAWDTPRVRALNVLTEMLTDLLRRRVREQMGDAYSPYAYNRSSEVFAGRGGARAIVMASPERLDAVMDAMDAIARALYDAGVNDDDAFARAKAPFAQLIDRQLQRNEYWLNGVLKRSWEHPELLERPLVIKAAYADMKPEAVNAVLKAFFAPEKAVRLRVVPVKP